MTSTSDDKENSVSTSFSITAEQFHGGDLKIPLASINGIWSKAEELVNEPGAIESAPKFPAGSIMVISQSGMRPHLAKVEGCLVTQIVQIGGICAHTVAIAHVNNILKTERFHRFFRVTKCNKSGIPSGVSNKGNRISKKRKQVECDTRIPQKSIKEILLLDHLLLIILHKQSSVLQSSVSSTLCSSVSLPYGPQSAVSPYGP